MKTDVPTYNFLLELIYEYQNRKNSVVFHVNFCFLILSFWGFSIMLFLICFFRHFITPIGVDYQYGADVIGCHKIFERIDSK